MTQNKEALSIPQEEGMASGEEVLLWQQDLRSEYNKEWEAAQRGEYRQSAEEYLSTNWQGEAIQVFTSQC